MTAACIMRFINVPSGNEVVVGNFESGTTTGGWGVGVNATGFKLWASRASDGAIQETTPTGIAAFSNYGTGHLLNRLFMVTVVISGTTASLYINGAFAQSITLTGGLRIAEATGYLTTSRNRSVATPLPTVSAGFCGLYYREVAQAAIYQRIHYTTVQAAGGVIQLVYPTYDTAGVLYRVVPGYPNAGPSAGSPLSEVGYIGTEALIPQW